MTQTHHSDPKKTAAHIMKQHCKQTVDFGGRTLSDIWQIVRYSMLAYMHSGSTVAVEPLPEEFPVHLVGRSRAQMQDPVQVFNSLRDGDRRCLPVVVK